MALTENAIRVYLGTDMGDIARESEDFEKFNSRWCAKMVMLSISEDTESLKTYEAMKAIDSGEFYWDANK